MNTLLACLTAPGKAAIATLAVRGPMAWEITGQLFAPRKGRLPDAPSAGKYWYGRIGTDHADDAILAVKRETPTVCLELHCHGGIEVVRMLQEFYHQRGAVIVPWQQFFDGHEAAGSHAPAWEPRVPTPERGNELGVVPVQIYDLLAHAPTTRTAGILLDQANGAWQSCLGEIRDAQERGDSVALMQKLQRLYKLIPLGKHLVEAWKVVVAGAPNVGKSSLINALAGYVRSIVSPIPGTTRDVVTVRLAIDGWPVEMADTAGIRPSTSDLEQQGINRALDAAHEADLRFWLLDGSTEPVFPDAGTDWHLLVNKIDLPAAWDWQSAASAAHISAKTQAGMAELCELISRQLVPNPPAPGEAVPCSSEQIEWVISRSGLPSKS
jgi:tRNA modification GTPase